MQITLIYCKILQGNRKCSQQLCLIVTVEMCDEMVNSCVYLSSIIQASFIMVVLHILKKQQQQRQNPQQSVEYHTLLL